MSAHELNSYLIYIHPPIALAGYLLLYTFTALLVSKKRDKRLKSIAYITWILTLLGLVTGMYWAQIAWGSYWSWDPKETMSLILFGLVSLDVVSYIEGNLKAARILGVISCIVVIITFSTSYIIAGLHSFL
jgi:ABC-type transport system involved in cytochrome c biogenesis permease subunit